MNSDFICSASSNGSSVAICTSDGVIKFYDTLTSSFKLEYSSSSHLQASCTCLAWSKKRKTSAPAVKSKKTKTSKDNSLISIENELSDLDLIAIGTSQGSILLYSLTKAAVHSEYVSLLEFFNSRSKQVYVIILILSISQKMVMWIR